MLTLTKIDGRKLSVTDEEGKGRVVYLRKGVESNQYLPLLHAGVELQTETEKGFEMVKDIKPSLPVTEATKAGPVDMPASQNVPKLDFSAGPKGFTDVSGGEGKKIDTRSQKDHDIMRQWAIGNVLQSRALSGANDAIALNTVQTMERAKKLAEELCKWVVTR